jgi:hypothetical protein
MFVQKIPDFRAPLLIPSIGSQLAFLAPLSRETLFFVCNDADELSCL